MRHDTKWPDEVVEAYRAGVREFLIPAYYWKGGRFPGDSGDVVELDDYPRGDLGIRLEAPTIQDAIGQLTLVCARNPGKFIFVRLEVRDAPSDPLPEGRQDRSKPQPPSK